MSKGKPHKLTQEERQSLQEWSAKHSFKVYREMMKASTSQREENAA